MFFKVFITVHFLSWSGGSWGLVYCHGYLKCKHEWSSFTLQSTKIKLIFLFSIHIMASEITEATGSFDNHFIIHQVRPVLYIAISGTKILKAYHQICCRTIYIRDNCSILSFDNRLHDSPIDQFNTHTFMEIISTFTVVEPYTFEVCAIGSYTEQNSFFEK